MRKVGQIKLERGVKYLHSYGWEKWLERDLVLGLTWIDEKYGKFFLARLFRNPDKAESDEALSEFIPKMGSELKKRLKEHSGEFVFDGEDSIYQLNRSRAATGATADPTSSIGSTISLSYLVEKPGGGNCHNQKII